VVSVPGFQEIVFESVLYIAAGVVGTVLINDTLAAGISKPVPIGSLIVAFLQAAAIPPAISKKIELRSSGEAV